MTIRTDGLQGISPGLDAAREGRTMGRWANAETGYNAAAATVQTAPAGTAPGAYINMVAGRRYIVTMIYYNLSTASDWVRFEVGVTDGLSGAGVFTAFTPYFNAATAATIEGSPPGPIAIDPPLAFTTADGACICMRLLTNDAGASVNCGFNGWQEEV